MLKNKHKGLMIIGVVVISIVCCVLIYGNGRSINAVLSGYQVQAPEVLKEVPFNQAEYEELAGLSENLERLSHPPVAKARDVHFAIVDEKHNQHSIRVKKIVQVRPFNYKVSMVFISDSNRYAVIGGRFVREGESLRDGAMVKEIRKGKVKISRKDGTRWVKVRSPHVSLKSFENLLCFDWYEIYPSQGV